MKTRVFALGLALLVMAGVAHADKHGLPAATPKLYLDECGSCHVAYPPQLLGPEDWQRVMARLDRHYGDNATLDEATRRTLEAFLVREAGGRAKLGAGGTARADEPPRLTQTAWFARKHREVSRRDWQAAKTPANCAACHREAHAGSYREREIVMPDGRRRGD